MILPVEIYGSPVLRRKSVEIDKNYPGLQELINNMFETMYTADGLGLAAPQIGKNIRLFIIDATCMGEDYPELAEFKKIFINAKIISISGEKWPYNEGCLSLPGIREDVERQSVIDVEYVDENFQQHKEQFDGIKARVFMHEYDHIEGVLFIDRLSLIRRKLLKGKLNNITKGNCEVSYKIRIPK